MLKGLWVGSTMTIPGVSGGTMAVIIGIYEDLICAINGLRKNPQKHIWFLLQFLLGAGVGFLFLAGWITRLLSNEATGNLTRCFFCGIVVGGIPLLVQKTGIQKIKPGHILYLVLGIGIVLVLTGLPQGMFAAGSGISFFLMQILGGVVIAVALVLPGISVTHMLYIMGLYELVLEKIYEFRFLDLLPLVVGVILGTFLTADFLEKIMKKYPAEVYMVIIGFVAGSVISLIPEDTGNISLTGVGIAVVGFFCMLLLSKYAVGKQVSVQDV